VTTEELIADLLEKLKDPATPQDEFDQLVKRVERLKALDSKQ
jgi:hypothetical protein